MRWFLRFVFALAACTPAQPDLDVVVTDAATGAALEGAVVAVTCATESTSENVRGGAAITDLAGHARVVVFTDTLSPCVVTASHPRFDPAQVRDLEICDAATCEPLTIALDEVVP